jgi:hypothetical protein
MKQPARDLLKRLGSKRAQVIGWRDMWAMVTQKGAKMFGESYSKSTEFNTWGAPVVLRTEVPLVPIEGKYKLTLKSTSMVFSLQANYTGRKVGEVSANF